MNSPYIFSQKSGADVKKVKIIPSVVLLSMILLMLLITSFETYSQSGNAKSLEIGNKWIYKNWSGYPGFPTEYNFYVVFGTLHYAGMKNVLS